MVYYGQEHNLLYLGGADVNKYNFKVILLILLILTLIGGIITYINLSTDKVNADGSISASWITKQKIIKIAKDEVLKSLVAPSTAVFSKNKDIKVVKVPNQENLYIVLNMNVDSANSYNAMLRQKVLMQIILNADGTYEMKNLMFL